MATQWDKVKPTPSDQPAESPKWKRVQPTDAPAPVKGNVDMPGLGTPAPPAAPEPPQAPIDDAEIDATLEAMGAAHHEPVVPRDAPEAPEAARVDAIDLIEAPAPDAFGDMNDLDVSMPAPPAGDVDDFEAPEPDRIDDEPYWG